MLGVLPADKPLQEMNYISDSQSLSPRTAVCIPWITDITCQICKFSGHTPDLIRNSRSRTQELILLSFRGFCFWYMLKFESHWPTLIRIALTKVPLFPTPLSQLRTTLKSYPSLSMPHVSWNLYRDSIAPFPQLCLFSFQHDVYPAC